MPGERVDIIDWLRKRWHAGCLQCGRDSFTVSEEPVRLAVHPRRALRTPLYMVECEFCAHVQFVAEP